jgi:hypothetical protein
MRSFILPILLLVAFPVFAAPTLTFEEVDTDGDGLISADEAANVEGMDFDAADRDNDGTLTADEYDIAVEKMSQSIRSSRPNPAIDSIPPPPKP